MPRVVGRLLATLVVVLLGAAPAGAQEAPPPTFAQLPGTDGCVLGLGASQLMYAIPIASSCVEASGLLGASAMAMTPDGRQMLVVSGAGSNDDGSNAIVALDRSPETGALRFAACLSDDGGDGRLGSGGACADADGLEDAGAVAVTADGRWVFATARAAGALTWFARDPASGTLQQRGCLKAFAWPQERCTTAPDLSGASGVAVDPDGTLVYVSSERSSAVSVYRLARSGELERVFCVSASGSEGRCARGEGLRGARELTVSSDGGTLAVTSRDAASLFDVDRNAGALRQLACFSQAVAAGGPCTAVGSLAGIESLTMSGDGRDLYVGAYTYDEEETLTALHREAEGAWSVTSCFVDRSETDDVGGVPCIWVPALDPDETAMSADGRAVFTGGFEDLGAFRRDPATGAITWAACASSYEGEQERGCGPAEAVSEVTALVASSDGRNLYAASRGGTVAVLGAAAAVATSATLRDDGTARLALRCPRSRPVGCAGAVRLTGRAASPATRFRVAAGARAWVRLRLGPAALQEVRSGRVRTISVTVTDAGGFTRAVRHRLEVRLPAS